jgi:hypothetical protein
MDSESGRSEILGLILKTYPNDDPGSAPVLSFISSLIWDMGVIFVWIPRLDARFMSGSA